MPSKRQYDLVQNDDYDTRIPLHPEEAFHHGISFQVKYIGMLDVPRPTSKVEIVAAMRRIRYEFKAKGIKKKKVTIEVSVDGVKVTLRKKKKRKHWLDDGKSLLLHHPIYRVFYVSHDSQDLKIFSYIARDGASNVFKCVVFKSSKKSQAMRIVRTVGQAFEVCHKLSIHAPENENLDHDEQDTLTQDLLSDRLSDITSDKLKRDTMSEQASDRMSLPPDESSLKDFEPIRNGKHNLPQLEILPPPPNNNTKKTSLSNAETYCSPLNDALTTVSTASSTNCLPPPGGTLSAHHELQLMREQLEQQSQQTQAAMVQLQLAREQLAAEQGARLEAQARTHQLLVHNRELLDHIAALVAHLQGDKPGQQQTPPHMTLPQHTEITENYVQEISDSPTSSSSPLHPPYQGLVDHRTLSGLSPNSPLRTTFNPNGSVFNFAYPQAISEAETQLLQKLQGFGGSYALPTPLQYLYSQTLPYLPTNFYNQPLLNNNYKLQPPPQKKIPASPLLLRNSYNGGAVENNSRNSEPRQLPNQFQHNQHQLYSNNQCQSQSLLDLNHSEARRQNVQINSNHLHIQQNQKQSKEASPGPSVEQFIKPLPQMGTLTTTDPDGRVRVIVPVPSDSRENVSDLLANFRFADTLRPCNGPGITRTTSEKVPNRSELMSQVQRTAWARHTTK